MYIYRLLTAIFVLILIPSVHASELLSLPSGDLVAPRIEHERIADKISVGESVAIQARVTDNVGVQSVILFYREIGTVEYQRIPMHVQDEAGLFFVRLATVQEPGIEYYLQASDPAGNTVLRGHTFSPLTVEVVPTGGGKTFAVTEPEIPTPTPQQPKGFSKWVWIGLGVIAVGALAAAGGGGGGGSEPPPTASLTITAPVPQ